MITVRYGPYGENRMSYFELFRREPRVWPDRRTDGRNCDNNLYVVIRCTLNSWARTRGPSFQLGTLSTRTKWWGAMRRIFWYHRCPYHCCYAASTLFIARSATDTTYHEPKWQYPAESWEQNMRNTDIARSGRLIVRLCISSTTWTLTLTKWPCSGAYRANPPNYGCLRVVGYVYAAVFTGRFCKSAMISGRRLMTHRYGTVYPRPSCGQNNKL